MQVIPVQMLTIDPAVFASAGSGDPIAVTVEIGIDQVNGPFAPMYFGVPAINATLVLRPERINRRVS